jgi:hypothetical protein
MLRSKREKKKKKRALATMAESNRIESKEEKLVCAVASKVVDVKRRPSRLPKKKVISNRPSKSFKVSIPRTTRKAHLTPQPLTSPRLPHRLPTHNIIPILPIPRHLRKHIPHDLRTSHKPMLLALQNADFAFPHQFAEPAHVIDGYTGVLGAVVDDDGAVDVFVAEADGLFCFETDDEVGGGVGVCGCAVPDGEGETLVEGALALFFGYAEGFLYALCFSVVWV